MRLGEYLVALLERHGVSHVFGIPGVHTAELYRGLAGSRIRHVTPRHEQGAGFMADGYARLTGRPGVCFVITGPGLTNIATAMAQAYQDSIPMLVISGVAATGDIGRGKGNLHELRDQQGLASKLAAMSTTLMRAEDLPEVLANAFNLFETSRPRPVHIQIPLDVMGSEAPAPRPATELRAPWSRPTKGSPNFPHAEVPAAGGPRSTHQGIAGAVPILLPGGSDNVGTAPQDEVGEASEASEAAVPSTKALAHAASQLADARRPIILAGGGAVRAGPRLATLAERLDAPIVMTVNARGLMPLGHPLAVPASPSLKGVQHLVKDADVVLAVGTEIGPTDYDMYLAGGFSVPGALIRIDIDAAQMVVPRPPEIALTGDGAAILAALLHRLEATPLDRRGAARAEEARRAAFAELSPAMRRQVAFLETIRDALPGAIIVGDSTQPVYAGNLYYEASAPRGWFNSATGYGTLGYALPAAIGAKLGAPERPVVCLAGDGGLQFTLAELGSALDAGTPVVALVWNNRGYGEIKDYMRDRDIAPLGVDLATPDFVAIARAYGWAAERLDDADALPALLRAAATRTGPTLIEIDAATIMKS